MCFSATASFVAGGALVGAGVFALVKAKKKSLRPYAAIPLLFGLQQVIEGAQWLAAKPSLLSTVLGYGFLFFAFLWWPTYIPYAAWRMEEHPKRRQLLSIVLGIGIAGSVYLLAILLTEPLTVQVLSHSICYDIDAPLEVAGVTMYILTVCGAIMLVRRPLTKLMGFVLLASALVSLWVFYEAFTSVWCFFAAVLSVIIVFDVQSKSKVSKVKAYATNAYTGKRPG